MAKMNISVPDELKERMDQWPDANWSKVAQNAFLRAVEINELKGSNMEAAGMARLRADRQQNKELVEAISSKAGREWGLGEGTFVEMDRVRALLDIEEVDMRMLTEAIRGDGPETRLSTAEMAETLFGRDNPTEQEIRGFIKGVSDVFDQI